MRTWAILFLGLGLQMTSRAADDNVRIFQPTDPDKLDAKVPHGFGRVFVEAGRQNDIDPVILASISALESGAWKSPGAQRKNNWMGLRTRSGLKRFLTPEDSIFYAAKLLNREPFKFHASLASIARFYCESDPTAWINEVHRWSLRLLSPAF